MTLNQKYRKGFAFAKVTILKSGVGEWSVLGPGRLWLGIPYDSWQAAVDSLSK